VYSLSEEEGLERGFGKGLSKFVQSLFGPPGSSTEASPRFKTVLIRVKRKTR